MVRTASTQLLDLGASAPDFALPDTEGRVRSPRELRGEQGLLVAFICNHCPFVRHIRAGLAAFGREYAARGLGLVAISSNDVESHPEDGPLPMREERRLAGYGFPYLYDESQSVARAYRAACTPDFFLFDRELRLAYRGQFDDSRPGLELPVTGADLRAAADALLAGRPVPAVQKPSLGCNIKWKPGREPAWAGG
ncbi:MAG TPA: thioredoxin family protein [Planctomycetota bacterium]|nr:thioredoxin family protein [Planctomycetota bacterium]